MPPLMLKKIEMDVTAPTTFLAFCRVLKNFMPSTLVLLATLNFVRSTLSWNIPLFSGSFLYTTKDYWALPFISYRYFLSFPSDFIGLSLLYIMTILIFYIWVDSCLALFSLFLSIPSVVLLCVSLGFGNSGSRKYLYV